MESTHGGAPARVCEHSIDRRELVLDSFAGRRSVASRLDHAVALEAVAAYVPRGPGPQLQLVLLFRGGRGARGLCSAAVRHSGVLAVPPSRLILTTRSLASRGDRGRRPREAPQSAPVRGWTQQQASGAKSRLGPNQYLSQ
jgi:hypothetical protein